jgi:iron complex outermembrane receptor protein
MKHNKKFYLNRITLALAVTLIGLTSTIALADKSPRKIEVIEVTAQKHSQNINEVGITVNAFSGEQLKDLGIKSSADLAIYTPGLTVNETSATGIPLYTIRGVGFQDYSTAASSTVGLYFDEISMPYAVMTRGVVFDVERVEVLKGPQGDLFGRNTTAGQINFISNKPTDSLEMGADLGYNSFNEAELEFFVSDSLTDSINGRFSLKTIQSSEGWQESLTRDDKLGEKDQLAMRTLFDITLNDDLSLLLNLHYVKDKSENTANTTYDGKIVGLNEYNTPYVGLEDYVLPTGSNFGETPPWYSTGDAKKADWTNSFTSPITGKTWNIRPKRDNELKGISAKLDWQLGDVFFTSVTGYNSFEREEANDWDGSTSVDSSNINTTDLDVFSQELRLSGETDNLLWIAGVYYSRDEMNEAYHYFMADSAFGLAAAAFSIPGPFVTFPILELDTRYKQKTESSAIFGHVEWKITNKFRITTGARYTEETRDWSGCTYDAGEGSLSGFLNGAFGANLAPGACGVADDNPESDTYIFDLLGTPNINDAFHLTEDQIKTKRWMGKIGADYAFNEDTLGYATMSHSFKSGGFNGANANTTNQLLPYDEELLTSYELGIKATLLEGSMQVNASTFYYDYEDKQETDIAVTFVGNIAGLTNIPESEIIGAEFDINWFPTDNLTVRLGTAYLDTEIIKWEAVDGPASQWPNTILRDASGGTLAQSPKWSHNALAKYEWLVAENLLMDVSIDYSFQDETSGGVEAERATESFSTTNVRWGVGSDDGAWRVTLWGRNITDEYYYPAAYRGGNGPYVRSAGLPRTYGINFSYNYY